jgi:hypothetical protein
VSRISFHQRDEEDTDLWGGERSYYANMSNAMFVACADQEAFKPFVPSYALTSGGEVIPHCFRTWLATAGAGLSASKISAFPIALNTAFAIGSPVMRWMARVHGSCEVHGWIAKDDAHYFHALISKGLEDKILRQKCRDMNIYDDLLKLLKKPKSDIVMSYSVCDSFPTTPKAWDKAFAELDPALRIEIDHIEKGDFRFKCDGFTTNVTVFDINTGNYELEKQ